MKKELHTVLGASGAIGQAVVRELQRRNLNCNAVGRIQKYPGVPTIQVDLLEKDAAIAALTDSAFVYLCIGLPYRSKVWQRDWPILMENVITACEKANAKLIFFDNVYMYGPTPLSVPFNEAHPQQPTTRKGIARKRTTDLLVQAMADKRIRAVIGRSADFYGEQAINSPLYISFLQRILQGKAPQVVGKKGIAHTYSYSGDNGKALVALALDDGTYGQVWHLPVGKPVTFDEVNDKLNILTGSHFRVGYVSKPIRKLLSVFIPPLREVEEMLYQFEAPYEMDFHKFQQHFPDFRITPYEEGLRRMVESFR